MLFQNNSNSSGFAKNSATDSNVADVMVAQFRKLMTTNLVVRLNNFTMWKVSTAKVKTSPREFLSGKKNKRCYARRTTLLAFALF